MERQSLEYHRTIREHLRTSYLLSEEKIEAVMPKFLETIRTLMSELENLADTDNNDTLSRKGHAMKGALLNLGLHDLAEKALSIEKHNQAPDNTPDCLKLINELKQEVEKII